MRGMRLLPLALSVALLAPLAEASLTRATSPALETPALTLTSLAPEPSEFSLFEGTELARAAAKSRSAESLHPLAAVSLLSKDGAEPPLVSAELIYPKTRYRVFDFLGAPLIGIERGVSLELRWGSAEFRAGIASGTVGWLSQDPLGDQDSVNLYGFVGGRPHEKTDPLGLAVSTSKTGIVISDERSNGVWYFIPWDLAYGNPASTVEMLRRGGLAGQALDAFLDANNISIPRGDEAARALAGMTSQETARQGRFAVRTEVAVAEAYGVGKAVGFAGRKLASVVIERAAAKGAGSLARALATDVGELFSKTPIRPSSPSTTGSMGGEFVDDALRMADQAFEGAAPGQTFRQVLTPSELAELESLKARFPDYIPDLDATARPTMTSAQTRLVRAQVRGRGHHRHPLAFGGEPNPEEGLVITGEAGGVKDPVHTEVTNFWNRVLRRVRGAAQP